MGIGELIWLFFVFSMLQPVIQQKLLEASRLRAISRLEKAHRSRVIALVHRQETMSFLGFPLMRYIDVNDSEQVLRAIKLTDPDWPIELILHTPGGLVLAANQIAHALKRRRAKVTVFVPHYAMSGGTLIALAADEIVMDPNAVLGPVDPQLGHRPAASILKVLDEKKAEDIEDETIVLADVSRKAILQLRRTVQELLAERMSSEQATQLADKLTTGTWTHDYGITADEGKALGLPISTEIPDAVHEFISLFPQPTRQRPNVEYVPVPYRGGAGNRAPSGNG
jgi:ClpP class serine protease